MEPTRILHVGCRFSSEGWRVRKDVSRFWALVVVDAIRDEQAQVIGFVKVTRDITDRQQAHNELLESERQYRRLIEAVGDYAIFQRTLPARIPVHQPPRLGPAPMPAPFPAPSARSSTPSRSRSTFLSVLNQLSELLATMLISECGTPAASSDRTAR